MARSKECPIQQAKQQGQLTIPIEVRHDLGVKEGDRVSFKKEGGRSYIQLAALAETPLRSGSVCSYFNNIEEIVDYYSDLRGHDEHDR